MTWDTTKPAGTDLLSSGDDEIRTFKTDLQTALQVEGSFPVNPASPAFRYKGGKGNTAGRPAAGSGGLYFNTDTGTLQRDNGASYDDVLYLSRNLILLGNYVSNTAVSSASAYDIVTSVANQGGGSVGTTSGIIAPRGGSITGFSIIAQVPSFTSNTTLNWRIKKNDSDLAGTTTSNMTITSATSFSINGTIAVGSATFAQGDRINSYRTNVLNGTIQINLQVYWEIAWAT